VEASGFLVVPLVFKTRERRAAPLAGSIPVRLRHLAHLQRILTCKTGIFLALALGLAGGCFWLLGRRQSLPLVADRRFLADLAGRA
jgi:hypothetical protein